jgi:hypothetical protein
MLAFMKAWISLLHKAYNTAKNVIIFPPPVGMLLTKLSLAGNNLIISGKGEFG